MKTILQKLLLCYLCLWIGFPSFPINSRLSVLAPASNVKSQEELFDYWSDFLLDQYHQIHALLLKNGFDFNETQIPEKELFLLFDKLNAALKKENIPFEYLKTYGFDFIPQKNKKCLGLILTPLGKEQVPLFVFFDEEGSFVSSETYKQIASSPFWQIQSEDSYKEKILSSESLSKQETRRSPVNRERLAKTFSFWANLLKQKQELIASHFQAGPAWVKKMDLLLQRLLNIQDIISFSYWPESDTNFPLCHLDSKNNLFLHHSFIDALKNDTESFCLLLLKLLFFYNFTIFSSSASVAPSFQPLPLSFSKENLDVELDLFDKPELYKVLGTIPFNLFLQTAYLEPKLLSKADIETFIHFGVKITDAIEENSQEHKKHIARLQSLKESPFNPYISKEITQEKCEVARTNQNLLKINSSIENLISELRKRLDVFYLDTLTYPLTEKGISKGELLFNNLNSFFHQYRHSLFLPLRSYSYREIALNLEKQGRYISASFFIQSALNDPNLSTPSLTIEEVSRYLSALNRAGLFQEAHNCAKKAFSLLPKHLKNLKNKDKNKQQQIAELGTFFREAIYSQLFLNAFSSRGIFYYEHPFNSIKTILISLQKEFLSEATKKSLFEATVFTYIEELFTLKEHKKAIDILNKLEKDPLIKTGKTTLSFYLMKVYLLLAEHLRAAGKTRERTYCLDEARKRLNSIDPSHFKDQQGLSFFFLYLSILIQEKDLPTLKAAINYKLNEFKKNADPLTGIFQVRHPNLIYLYQALGYASTKDIRQTQESLKAFFKKEQDPGLSVPLLLQEMMQFPNESHLLESALLSLLEKYQHPKEPLPVFLINIYDFLYQYNPIKTYALILDKIQREEIKDAHLLLLLNRFDNSRTSSLYSFFLRLSSALKKENMPRSQRKLSTLITLYKNSFSSFERLHLVAWHLKEGDLEKARKQVKRIEGDFRKMLLEQQEILKEKLLPYKKELTDKFALEKLLKETFLLLKNKSFERAYDRLEEEISKGVFKKENQHYLSALSFVALKCFTLFTLFREKKFNELLTSPDLRLTAEELDILPVSLKDDVLTLFSEAKKFKQAAQKAGKMILSLNAYFDKSYELEKPLPLSKIDSLLKTYWSRFTKFPNALSMEEVEKEKNKLATKISNKMEKAKEEELAFTDFLEKGLFQEAIDSIEQIFSYDFPLPQNEGKISLARQLLNKMISQEYYKEASLHLFERLSGVIEQLLLSDPFHALSENGFSKAFSISSFIASFSTDQKFFYQIWRAKKELDNLLAEQNIVSAFMFYEEAKQDIESKHSYYNKRPILKPLFPPDKKKKQKIKAFTSKGFLLHSWSYKGSNEKYSFSKKKTQQGFVKGDTYKLIFPKNKSLYPFLILSRLEKDHLVFQFPDYINRQQKRLLLDKMKNGPFFIQRFPPSYYTDQYIVLKNLTSRLSLAIQKAEVSLEKNSGIPKKEEPPITEKKHYDLLFGLTSFSLPKISSNTETAPFLALLDSWQQKAFLAATQPERVPLLPLVGPGGTGKTHLLEQVLEWDRLKKNNVLVTAPTHAAVDVLAVKLLKANSPFIRVGNSPDRIGYSIQNPLLKEALLNNWENRKGLMAKALLAKKGLLLLGTATGFNEKEKRMAEGAFGKITWDRIIVDEAGKMAKPELLVLLKDLSSSGQLILAGDPAQLPPHPLDEELIKTMQKDKIYKNTIEKQVGLKLSQIFKIEIKLSHQISFLEQLVEKSRFPLYYLKTARRAVPLLSALAKKIQYGDDLLPRDAHQQIEATSLDALKVLAYKSESAKKTNPENTNAFYETLNTATGSRYNNHEIAIALKQFFSLFNSKMQNESWPTIEDVLFISPYREQNHRYDAALRITTKLFIKLQNGLSLGQDDFKNIPEEVRLFILKNKKAALEWRLPDITLLEPATTSEILRDENEAFVKEKIHAASTIPRIQGGERPYIIFSCVRSNDSRSVGFYASKQGPAFITVAITRAKEKLVIIFDETTFKQKPYKTKKELSKPTPYKTKKEYSKHFANKVSKMLFEAKYFYLDWISNRDIDIECWRGDKDFQHYYLFEEAI